MSGGGARHGFRTSMIPVINSFLAAGLISLPGMMTGQILSGVSPLIAMHYLSPRSSEHALDDYYDDQQ